MRRPVQPRERKWPAAAQQEQTDSIVRQLNALPLILRGPGQELDVHVPAAGSATVSHRLGHTPRNWLLIGCDAATAVGVTASDESTITFSEAAGTAVHIKVWIV